ncbi:MAG: hypothetical protein UW95_C0018G0007 [Parcubacteria group bacterium GW2011_GWC1_45_14]|nr:MAG: hypothetical protein UW95_C0018G0007 [Parcubacteria group bacterium GW2011_GWC1_45_14]
MSLIKFKIEGFHCEACVKVAKMKLGKLTDVSELEINSDGKGKIVSAREIGISEINQALLETGYKAELS